MATEIKPSLLAIRIAEALFGVAVRNGWLKQSSIDDSAVIVQAHLNFDQLSREGDAFMEKEDQKLSMEKKIMRMWLKAVELIDRGDDGPKGCEEN